MSSSVRISAFRVLTNRRRGVRRGRHATSDASEQLTLLQQAHAIVVNEAPAGSSCTVSIHAR